MKNSTYWQKRFEELESILNQYGQEAFAKIQPAFDQATRDINAEIEKWIYRISVNNEISMADARKLLNADELAEFKWSVEEYIKYGKENAINQQWMKQLENASAKYHISRLDALKLHVQQAEEVAFGNYLDLVDGMARKVYSEGYYRSIFEVQKGFGIGWNVASIDENKLSKLIIKPWASDGKNFSDRIWTAKTQMVNDLHSEMTRACILGKAPDEAIKNLSKYVNKKFSNAKVQAGRLVMTEQAFFSAASQKDAFNELGVEEFEIVATLDSHTSAICQDLDGKHFPMKNYEPGVTAPPFHVWCRSTTCPYFDDEFSIGERAARDAEGKTYYVPSNMTYPKWKKYNDSIAKEPRITSDTKKVVKGTDSRLEGLDFRLKTPESFVRKVNTDIGTGLNERYVLDHTFDVVRYTNLCNSIKFYDNYCDIVEKLTNKGYTLCRVKNTFSKPGVAYRGLNTVFSTTDGFYFELQFHTPESLKLKDMIHELYEQMRLDTTPVDKKKALEAKMVELSSQLRTPYNSEKIKDLNNIGG